MRYGGKSKTGMQQPCRFRHVVDIDRLPGDVLVRGIVPPVGGDAARDALGLEVRLGSVHAARSRLTVTSFVVPVVSK